VKVSATAFGYPQSYADYNQERLSYRSVSLHVHELHHAAMISQCLSPGYELWHHNHGAPIQYTQHKDCVQQVLRQHAASIHPLVWRERGSGEHLDQSLAKKWGDKGRRDIVEWEEVLPFVV